MLSVSLKFSLPFFSHEFRKHFIQNDIVLFQNCKICSGVIKTKKNPTLVLWLDLKINIQSAQFML